MALGGPILGIARVVLRADNGGLRRDLATSEAMFDTATGRMRAAGERNATTLAQTLSATGRTLQGVGRDLTRYVTVPLAAAGAAGFKMAEDLDEALDKVVGLVGISRQQVNAWRDDLLKLGPQLAKSPAELADALFFVTSAGLRGQKALDALTQSARASAAGLGETRVVADAVTSAMNAYADSGLTAEQATDVLVATVREGKTEAAALAPVLGRVLPIASELGVSFNQVGAAIAAMTRTGTDADTAATQLRASLASLVKVTPGAADALKSVGLSAEDVRAELREKGLLATLQDLEQRFHGNIAAIAKVFPNIRALTAELQLTGQAGDQTAAIFGRMADTTGSTAKAFRAATDDDFFRTRQALIELQVAATKFGAAVAPAISTVAHAVGGLADGFQSLPKPAHDSLIKLLEIAALAGPMLLLTGGVLRLAGAFGTLAGAEGVGAATGSLSGRGGLLAAFARLPKSVRIPIVVAVSATFAYPSLKKLFEEGFGADFSGPQAAGDLIPVHRGGKWVDPNTGKPVPDQAYWERQYQQGTGRFATPPNQPAGGGGAPAARGAVSYALSKRGAPYEWGGGGGASGATAGIPGGPHFGPPGTPGFDCSGLIASAYASVGITLPRTSQGMAKAGVPISLSQLAPGDILVVNGGRHVIMYIGNGQVVAASSTSGKVVVQPLSIWAGRIVAARRIVPEREEGAAQAATKAAATHKLPGPRTPTTRTTTTTTGRPDTDTQADRLDRLDLLFARAELTPGLADDLRALEAQDKLINEQLRRRNLTLAQRLDLLRRQAAVREQIKDVAERMPPEPSATRFDSSVGGLLKTVGELEAGRSGRQRETEIPGYGKILTPVAPNLKDWLKILDQLKAKLKAALTKLAAARAALKKLMRMPARIRALPSNVAAIARLQATIKLLERDVADLRAAIVQVQVAVKDLYEAGTDPEVIAAEEGEDLNLGGDSGPLGHGPVVEGGFEIGGGEPVPVVPGEPGTGGGGEGGGGAGGGGEGGTLGESELGPEDIAEQLNKKLEANVFAFLSALRALRADQDTILTAAAPGLKGTHLTIINQFKRAPHNPRKFLKMLEFDIQAMVN